MPVPLQRHDRDRFHDSHLALPKWFAAVYLLCEAKKGMSALQLKRTLGVAQKTAWYLCHRIRAAMIDPDAKPLSGIVEVDETYIGGKTRAPSSHRRQGWTPARVQPPRRQGDGARRG